jgi:hypothetical protein
MSVNKDTQKRILITDVLLVLSAKSRILCTLLGIIPSKLCILFGYSDLIPRPLITSFKAMRDRRETRGTRESRGRGRSYRRRGIETYSLQITMDVNENKTPVTPK